MLDGHSAAALAIVRSLGRAGHKIFVGSRNDVFSPASLSRYCQFSLAYPDPLTNASRFFSHIKKAIREKGIDVVIPATDATLGPLVGKVNEFREQGPPSLVILPPQEANELVSDKYRTLLLAKELGIPVPNSILISSLDNIHTVSGWAFPIVIKDRYSVRWANGKGIAGGVSFAYSKDDLREKVQQRLHAVNNLLLQSFSPGVGIGFSCLAIKGQAYLPFQWERIREKDPRGSGSSARKSIPLDPFVMKFSHALVAQSGIEGILMVEFKRDLRSGGFTLMEINGRPWGSLQLPIHCGINYPVHLVNFYLDGTFPPKIVNYLNGITCRWLVADLVHLENVWTGKPQGWPCEYPSFLSTLLKVSIPWYPGLRYDHLSLNDPMPGVADILQWLRSRVHREKLS